MSNARRSAVAALSVIFSGRDKPKKAVDAGAGGLDSRDRAFLMEIVYGVVRYRDTLDWILAHLLRQPEGLGEDTRNNLRAAVYQILFMRVADWAVVHEAVELEKRSSGRAKAGLVNGVLRNVLRDRGRFTPPLRLDTPAEGIAVNASHPRWLIDRWIRRFGLEEASALAEANNRIPRLAIRANTRRTTRDELLHLLASHGVGAAPALYAPDGIVLDEVRTYESLSFARGLFVVQDEASQLVTLLLAPVPGERVLDVGAAPGGKTTHICQLMKDTGEIVAVESDPSRIRLLNENISLLGLASVRVVSGDIRGIPDDGTYDRVLVDAPCSALGVIRRNPDVKYRHTEHDLVVFGERQLSILVAAARRVREGGTVVYSVCSTEPEEGEDVVAAFLKQEPEFRIIEAAPSLPAGIVSGGMLRTFPHRHAMDGFFGVALCRKR